MPVINACVRACVRGAVRGSDSAGAASEQPPANSRPTVVCTRLL